MSVDLKISVHPDSTHKKSELELNMMTQELAELPPITEGDINLDVVYTVKWEDKLEVGYYLRNASDEWLYFRNVPVKLVSSKGKVLADQVINLSEIGDIEPYSARPYEMFFDNENLKSDEIENTNLKLEFESNSDYPPYVYIIEDKEPEQLSVEQLTRLTQKVKQLPPVKEGGLNLSPFEAELQDDGSMVVGIIVRHKLPNPISLSRFQLELLDENNKTIAQAVLKIKEFTLESGMFFFRTFTLPPKTIVAGKISIGKFKINLF